MIVGMYLVAMLKRRLRTGKTYVDFRKTWFHQTGFASSNRMLTMLSVENPNEVIVIGITKFDSLEEGQRLMGVDQQERGASPLDEIIEPEIDRTFGVLVADDDFGAAGHIDYRPPEVDGHPVDLSEIEAQISIARQMLELPQHLAKSVVHAGPGRSK